MVLHHELLARSWPQDDNAMTTASAHRKARWGPQDRSEA